MPIFSEHPQGSAEWLQERVGVLTASRVSDALATTKNGESEKRRKLKYALIAERLSGVAEYVYVNAAMQRGKDEEPAAREYYQSKTGNEVVECGLVFHSDIEWYAASPDGIIGIDGLLEIKVPSIANHIETLARGEIPEQHLPQMLTQLLCCDRTWCDFVSYCPELPEPYRIFIKRFEPTEAERCDHFVKVVAFLEEATELMADIEWRMQA